VRVGVGGGRFGEGIVGVEGFCFRFAGITGAGGAALVDAAAVFGLASEMEPGMCAAAGASPSSPNAASCVSAFITAQHNVDKKACENVLKQAASATIALETVLPSTYKHTAHDLPLGPTIKNALCLHTPSFSERAHTS